MSNDVRAPLRRRLGDLYQRGKEVTIGDDTDGPPVTIYLAKISDADQATCGQKASAARARFLIIKNNKDHPDRLSYYDQLDAFGFNSLETLATFVAAPKVQEAEYSHEARIAAEDKWAKDDYLRSLQEAWNNGLKEKYLEDDTDEEAKRVFDELKRYTVEVDEAVASEREELVADLMEKEENELLELAVDRLIEIEADAALMDDFQKWRLYFAVREPNDINKRYFSSPDEVGQLNGNVLEKLSEEYRELTVDVIEGKD